MRRASMALLLVLGGAASGAGQAKNEDPVVFSGSDAYRTYCATCHGVSARGDGPLAESLRSRPPDLTLIAKRNQGQFPDDKVSRIVDGREPVKGHGGPDMPVWGDAFRKSASVSDEAAAKAKIRAVVEYLKSLQAPPG